MAQSLAGMAPALKNDYLDGKPRRKKKRTGFLRQVADERRPRER